jgi:NADH dehydrogenase
LPAGQALRAVVTRVADASIKRSDVLLRRRGAAAGYCLPDLYLHISRYTIANPGDARKIFVRSMATELQAPDLEQNAGRRSRATETGGLGSPSLPARHGRHVRPRSRSLGPNRRADLPGTAGTRGELVIPVSGRDCGRAVVSIHTVTGAFGYSGKYITQRLLDIGVTVRTLTNSPDRKHSFGQRIEVAPYNFDAPDALARSLEGTEVLYNTYWVRFNHRSFNHHEAVSNTLTLFNAAQRAGVRRIVHVSITNPSEDSGLEYFSGKARLERELMETGISYAILRPAVLFGHEDILINNIAWALRRFPVFGVFGDGQYRLQPIHVDDFAALAVEQGGNNDNALVNAIGPETFSYQDLVKCIGAIIGKPRPTIPVSPSAGYWISRLVGWFVGDTFVTRDEIAGLMQGLLYVSAPPAGTTKLSEWARASASVLGVKYASELARRRDRKTAYDAL